MKLLIHSQTSTVAQFPLIGPKWSCQNPQHTVDDLFYLGQWITTFVNMMTSSNGNISRVTGPRWIPRSPVNSPHKGQWRGALMFSLICTRKKGWVNNGEAGDLRRHPAHYDVTVMPIQVRYKRHIGQFNKLMHWTWLIKEKRREDI